MGKYLDIAEKFDGTDWPGRVVGSGADAIEQIIENGEVIAVLICSKVLEAHIWFAFDDSFNPGDGLVIFYPDELQFLKDKGSQTLRKIHEAKLKLGNGGGRVVQ